MRRSSRVAGLGVPLLSAMMDFENTATESPPRSQREVTGRDRNPMQDDPPASMRSTIEGTLGALLDAEADRLEERSCQDPGSDPDDGQAASTGRRRRAEAGSAIPRVSLSRNQPVRVAIVERYRQRRGSMEEAMLELYHAGISLRQTEDLTEALWGARVNLSTVSEFAGRIARRIEDWRNRPIKGRHPYVHLGSINLKRSWGGEQVDATVLAATGVNEEGFREVLGVAGGAARDPQSWRRLFSQLKSRGLAGTRLFVGEQSPQLADAIAETYPRAALQSCVWHFTRSVLSAVPFAQLMPVEQMLRAIYASQDRHSAERKAIQVIGQLDKIGRRAVAAQVEQGVPPTLRYYQFPGEHWRLLRTSYSLLKLLREVRERTRIVGAFSDPNSAGLLVGARLRWVAGRRPGWRRGWRYEVNMGAVF